MTQFQELDTHHQHLYDCIDELRYCLDPMSPRFTGVESIHRLVEMLLVHFLDEEIEMEHRRYPEFVAHQMDHKRLMNEMMQLETLISLEHDVGDCVIGSIKALIDQHAATADMAYVAWAGQHRT